MNANTAIRAAKKACALMAVVILLLSSSFFILPTRAEALTTDSVTARSNEEGGKAIIGGKPTRLQWRGVVGENEKVKQIVLNFPEGCSLDTELIVSIEEMVRDDPLHPYSEKNLKYSYVITEKSLIVNFDDGVRPNNILLILISGFIFPDEGGDFYISGTYIDDRGVSHKLDEPDRPIHVIAKTWLEQFLLWLDSREAVQFWNSVIFLDTFFNPVRAIASVPTLTGGWLISVALVAIGFPLAIPVGLGISFLRMSRFRILRLVSSIYVNVIRGTPLFLQIYIAFLGLPLFISNMDNFTTGFVVLALNSSAYLAEIFRAGIQSIHKGQFEAASSLGMNGFQTMFFVIIPQTIRRVIPTMTSEFILLFKDTSLLAAVGVMEMMMFAKIQTNVYVNMTPYVVAAGFYLLVTLPLTRVISVFEKKLAATDGREAPPADKKKKTKRVGMFKTIVPEAVETS